MFQKRRRSCRPLTVEGLEKRQLMAGDLPKVDDPPSAPPPCTGLYTDVDGDGMVTPRDAHAVLYQLYDLGGVHHNWIHVVPGATRWYDVDFDGLVTPLDALLVLNAIARHGGSHPFGMECAGQPVEVEVKIDLDSPETLSPASTGAVIGRFQFQAGDEDIWVNALPLFIESDTAFSNLTIRNGSSSLPLIADSIGEGVYVIRNFITGNDDRWEVVADLEGNPDQSGQIRVSILNDARDRTIQAQQPGGGPVNMVPEGILTGPFHRIEGTDNKGDGSK